MGNNEIKELKKIVKVLNQTPDSISQPQKDLLEKGSRLVDVCEIKQNKKNNVLYTYFSKSSGLKKGDICLIKKV
jgi:hypothetical protein